MSGDTATERELIHSLAWQVRELAASSENAQRQRLWCDVHGLRMPERPPVICHPGCWDELLPRDSLTCQDPFLAGVEYALRQKLYKWSLGDDTVLESVWPVPVALELEGEHMWGLPVGYTRPSDPRGAWRYVHPVCDEADLEALVLPRYTHNRRATRESLERHEDLLGDILPVRQVCSIPGPGAWLHGWATQLCGVQELLVYMMDRPEWVHRLMALLRDGFLDVMEQVQRMRVLTLNNTGLWACDDLPQADFDGVHVRLRDLWGRGESQEFEGVGPAQYEEFLLHYQKPILARFGLTYYGCCEDLTNKIDLVLGIPNLRKFVCSPWTDLEKLVERTGDRYCIEWRQKATDVVFSFETQRKHIRQGLQTAKGVPLHLTLQELETVDGKPERLAEWAALAKEVGAESA